MPEEDYQSTAMESKVRVKEANIMQAANELGMGERKYPKVSEMLMVNPFAKPKKGKKGGKKKKKWD